MQQTDQCDAGLERFDYSKMFNTYTYTYIYLKRKMHKQVTSVQKTVRKKIHTHYNPCVTPLVVLYTTKPKNKSGADIKNA